MGCGNPLKSIEHETRRIGSQVDDIRAKGTKLAIDPLGLHGGIKKGWDDARGATALKAAEEAAARAETARLQAETYQRGAKQTVRKTEKKGSGRGARGTRLVRQPLGTYNPPA